MSQTSNPTAASQTRRMAMEESFQDVPRHFAADDDLIGSHLAATLWPSSPTERTSSSARSGISGIRSPIPPSSAR